MTPDRFVCKASGASFTVVWPADHIKSIMEAAIQEVQGAAGDSSVLQAKKEKELGLTDFGVAVAGLEDMASPFTSQLFMMSAVIASAPAPKLERTWGRLNYRIAVDMFMAVPLWVISEGRRLWQRWKSGKELSHQEKMQLVHYNLNANAGMTKSYQDRCGFLSAMIMVNSQNAANPSLER